MKSCCNDMKFMLDGGWTELVTTKEGVRVLHLLFADLEHGESLFETAGYFCPFCGKNVGGLV